MQGKHFSDWDASPAPIFSSCKYDMMLPGRFCGQTWAIFVHLRQWSWLIEIYNFDFIEDGGGGGGGNKGHQGKRILLNFFS